MKNKKTQVCRYCDRRFRLHEWQIGVEMLVCCTCYVALKSIVESAFSYEYITEQEYRVMKFRFGIGYDKSDRTEEETGKLFGISCERVRQIEETLLKKVTRIFKGDESGNLFEKMMGKKALTKLLI